MARPTLFTHRKFLKLSRLLGSEVLALGHLEFLWHAANESGDPVLGEAEDVEALARWRGEPGALVKALLECGCAGGAGFIDARPDGQYEIHDYWHHAPEYVGSRHARESERRREKTCEFCQRIYYSTDPRSRYCSAACRQGGYRDRKRDAVTDSDGTSVTPSHSPSAAPKIDSPASLSAARRRPLRDGSRDGTARPKNPESDASVTDRDGLCDGVTDRYGTPAPAPAPAPAHREKTVLDTSSGWGKGSSSRNGVGAKSEKSIPRSPPQDPRSFDAIKENVAALAERLKTTDPDRIHKLAGASHRLSREQCRVAVKQLREDGFFARMKLEEASP